MRAEMKRSQFFAFLAGLLPFAAKAQQGGTGNLVLPNDSKIEVDIRWRHAKALANQCPVCGTMAKPVQKLRDSVGPWVVRCKRCNGAFFQEP